MHVNYKSNEKHNITVESTSITQDSTTPAHAWSEQGERVGLGGIASRAQMYVFFSSTNPERYQVHEVLLDQQHPARMDNSGRGPTTTWEDQPQTNNNELGTMGKSENEANGRGHRMMGTGPQ
jgi:hypothetical protein